MPDSALYFPYAEPRNDVALSRVLLYWDRLGTITPRPWRYHDRSLEEFVDVGLIRPIHAGEYLRRRDSDDFLARLDTLLDQVTPARHPIAPVLIHTEKTDEAIRRLFMERGLAMRLQGQEGFVLEGSAGAVYLAYLAHYLARQPELDMEPITDQRLLLEATAGFRPMSLETAIEGVRSSVLTGVLPAPGEWVPAQDLVRFKERHYDELRALRSEVEQRALDCAREPDAGVRRRTARLAAEELKDRIESVRARMAEKKWPTATGVVCAIVQGAPAFVAGAAAHSAAVAATGAGPLIIDYLNQNRGERDRDLAATYGAFAQDAFPELAPIRGDRRGPRRRVS